MSSAQSERTANVYGAPITNRETTLIGKLAGILAESHMEPQRLRFVVIGIGVNVFYNQEDFVGEFRYPPTSLRIELGSEAVMRRQDILCQFGKEFEKSYEIFLRSGWAPWTERLRESSILLGRFLTINTGAEQICGTAVDFSPTGGIILKTTSGQFKEIWVGDVERVSWD
jgi:BirA family biotin operon repressor/biotin-[acetyl-CoA-carboxylase] ligase